MKISFELHKWNPASPSYYWATHYIGLISTYILTNLFPQFKNKRVTIPPVFSGNFAFMKLLTVLTVLSHSICHRPAFNWTVVVWTQLLTWHPDVWNAAHVSDIFWSKSSGVVRTIYHEHNDALTNETKTKKQLNWLSGHYFSGVCLAIISWTNTGLGYSTIWAPSPRNRGYDKAVDNIYWAHLWSLAWKSDTLHAHPPPQPECWHWT